MADYVVNIFISKIILSTVNSMILNVVVTELVSAYIYPPPTTHSHANPNPRSSPNPTYPPPLQTPTPTATPGPTPTATIPLLHPAHVSSADIKDSTTFISL